MPLSSADFPKSAAVIPRLLVVESTGSTNADLVAAVTEAPDAWPHLSAVVTDDQRSGRGRLNRSWTAPPGSALAVSLVVRTAGIPSEALGWIPLIAGVAMADAIAEQLMGRVVAVKWPNDVLLDGLKISGILAELVGDVVVVGAGVNTSMARSDLPVPTAVSFAAIGQTADQDELLARYVIRLRALLDVLSAAEGDAEASGIAEVVTQCCASLNTYVRVLLPGGAGRAASDADVLEGRAVRIGSVGELVVKTESGHEHAVTAGDVVHVR